MSLIGFRRDGGEIEYLEEVEYSDQHLEDDLHDLIREEPRLVMGTLTPRDSIILGSKLQLPSGKELDLLTCDMRGKLTVIEFKRNRSPRSAITQLFDYASSLERLGSEELFDLIRYDSVGELYDAFDREEGSEFDISDFEQQLIDGLKKAQLMLVAYSITEDVRRITRWLRDVHELKVNCVEFDYYERDDAEMFVPNVIGADETKEITEKEASPREQKYRRFYGEILDRFKNELPSVTNRSATGDSWLDLPTGHKDVEIGWHFKGDPGDKRFWVTTNFKLNDPARNEELLDTIVERLDETRLGIEDELHKGGEYGTNGYTRFYFKREVGTLDDAVEDEVLKSWAVDTMAALQTFIRSELETELR